MRGKKLLTGSLLLVGSSVLAMPLVVEAQHDPPSAAKKREVFADLPLQLRERVVCSIAAAAKYEIPANVLLAVAEMEGGKPGQWVLNANGTHDVGTMQFNTAYLRGLAKYGITPGDVAATGCYSFDLAAWRLRRHIKNDSGDLWTRVANYHSRTYEHNAAYRKGVMAKARKWADWLAARVTVREVVDPERGLNTSVYVPRKITGRLP
jgi:hypothetical protein